MKGHDLEFSFRKPFKIPEQVDAERLKNSFMKSSLGKSEPCLIKMKTLKPRDNNLLYPNVEFQTGQKLTFQQPLP